MVLPGAVLAHDRRPPTPQAGRAFTSSSTSGVGPGIGERQVLETEMPCGDLGRAPLRSACLVDRLGEVARARPGVWRRVQPDARGGSRAHRPRHRCTSRVALPAASTKQDLACGARRCRSRSHEHDWRPRRRAPNAAHAAACARPRCESWVRRDRAGTSWFPRRRCRSRRSRSGPMTAEADLLARACAVVAGHEEVAGQPLVADGDLPPLIARSAHRDASPWSTNMMGRAEQREEPPAPGGSWPAGSTRDRPGGSPTRPGGEQRHEEVIEGEDLIAQDREAVEVLGPLVVLDRGDRRLQCGPRGSRGRSTPGPGTDAATRSKITTRRNQVSGRRCAETDRRARSP